MPDLIAGEGKTCELGAGSASPNRHVVNQRFSRMLHKIAGRILLSDPNYLAVTRTRLLHVIVSHPSDKTTWLSILDLPVPEIARIIARNDPEMARLRSVSPFILPEKFRDPVLRRVMLRKAARGVAGI